MLGFMEDQNSISQTWVVQLVLQRVSSLLSSAPTHYGFIRLEKSLSAGLLPPRLTTNWFGLGGVWQLIKQCSVVGHTMEYVEVLTNIGCARKWLRTSIFACMCMALEDRINHFLTFQHDIILHLQIKSSNFGYSWFDKHKMVHEPDVAAEGKTKHVNIFHVRNMKSYECVAEENITKIMCNQFPSGLLVHATDLYFLDCSCLINKPLRALKVFWNSWL